MLVKETQESVDAQRAIVANLEKRGLDPTLARKHLTMMEVRKAAWMLQKHYALINPALV